MNTNSEWLEVGGKAAVLAIGTNRKVHFSEIKTIGKRDVVLTNGERFNINRMWKSTGTWNPTLYLLPLDDPDVEIAYRDQRIQGRLTSIMNHAHIASGEKDYGKLNEVLKEIRRMTETCIFINDERINP